MEDYKIIFSDIDGTLLNSEHQISKRTKEKINKLVQKGIDFILVSARMPEGVEVVQNQLSIKCPIICYSGGLILDEEGNILQSTAMKKSQAVEIKKYINENYSDVSASTYSFNSWIVDDRNNYWIKQEADITHIEPYEADIEKYLSNNQSVHKILCMGDENLIEKLEKDLIKKYDDFTIYKSKSTYIEIMPKLVLKSSAIKVICDKKNIQREETIAFGDSFNDIDMLEYAGKGIAMGNAHIDVKNAADCVTDTNDNEGLYKKLEEFFTD